MPDSPGTPRACCDYTSLRFVIQGGVRPAKKKAKQAQKPASVQKEETHFNDGMRDPIANQKTNTVNF